MKRGEDRGTRENAFSHVRFPPQSGHVQCSRPCPLWANSGHAVKEKPRHMAGALLFERCCYQSGSMSALAHNRTLCDLA